MSTKETFKVYVTADGVTTDLLLWRSAKDADTNPVILLVPAMGVPASYYEPVATNLIAKSYTFAVADNRGTGSSSVRASKKVDYGYYDLASQDLPSIIAKVKELFPKNKLILFGHSLGGQVISLYLAKLHQEEDQKALDQVAAVVFTASGSVYWKGFPTLGNRLLVLVYAYTIMFICFLLGCKPKWAIAFGGNQSRTIMRDWAHDVRFGHWNPQNCPYPNLESNLAKITTPTYWLTINGDTFITQKNAAHLKNKMTSSASTHEHYTTKELDIPTSGSVAHVRWARTPAGVVNMVTRWLSLQNL